MPGIPTLRIEGIDCQESLYKVFGRIDISVPPQDVRENWQREWWAIFRLVSTMAKNERLTYPFSLEIRGDNRSPDALIDGPSGITGLEATTTPCDDFLDKVADAERFCPEGYSLESGPEGSRYFSFNSRDRLGSPGWAANEPEEKWADWVAQAVSVKLRKLNKTHFKNFPENWLSVYSNTPCDVDLNLDAAIKYLQRHLESVWKEEPHFDAIFIEHSNELVCLSEQEFEVMRVHDIWRVEGAL